MHLKICAIMLIVMSNENDMMKKKMDYIGAAIGILDLEIQQCVLLLCL